MATAIKIGEKTARGLGVGGDPSKGRNVLRKAEVLLES